MASPPPASQRRKPALSYELVAVRAGDLRLDGDIGIWDVAVHRVRKKVLPGTKQHAKGRKNVRIDQHTTALLRPLWQRRLRDGGAGAWMFPAAGRAKRSGRSITAAALNRFLVVAHENGIIPKLSAKTCRQTHITLAGLAGISEKMVMLNVGHNSQQVHDLYNRPSEQPRQDAARKFGDVLHGDAHLQKVGTRVGTGDCYLEID